MKINMSERKYWYFSTIPFIIGIGIGYWLNIHLTPILFLKNINLLKWLHIILWVWFTIIFVVCVIMKKTGPRILRSIFLGLTFISSVYAIINFRGFVIDYLSVYVQYAKAPFQITPDPLIMELKAIFFYKLLRSIVLASIFGASERFTTFLEQYNTNPLAEG